ncbi:ferric reductase-like transmembrane domain-containing protein [Oceaniovalibus sp. ACAM 378]|uniref:ferric reductase-like transmembrane domain-containing protein n=1 Tax=Oceaniovalibus sp. ACAM 378 TaxID=2599923 RepID=UPI0011DA20E4|nr:ferric reductase-like transmembrane domain-containing protein [Oceaniovalibus sp. ACAM 378]TYB90044.1 hypothetical protein FQ320_04080 [Oceaniovalibus sp. ACAM 378]
MTFVKKLLVPIQIHIGTRNTAVRHLLVAALGLSLLGVFAAVHSTWSPMHRWNRSFGDAAMVLVALSVGIGPLARLLRSATRLLALRRELGIWACLYAVVHTAIVLVGWVEYDLMRLFGFEWHPELQAYVMFQQGFSLANAVGLSALLLVILLAATSSNLAMRRLGVSGWKFLQMGVLPLWWLTVAHAGYFLFIHFLSFHRAVPDPNPLRPWFAGLVVMVLLLRWIAYIATVRAKGRAVRGSAGTIQAPLGP